MYSSSADNSFKVWNTATWKCEATKTYPSTYILFKRKRNTLPTLLSYNGGIIAGRGNGRIDVFICI